MREHGNIGDSEILRTCQFGRGDSDDIVILSKGRHEWQQCRIWSKKRQYGDDWNASPQFFFHRNIVGQPGKTR